MNFADSVAVVTAEVVAAAATEKSKARPLIGNDAPISRRRTFIGIS